jgi:hypothetical protein
MGSGYKPDARFSPEDPAKFVWDYYAQPKGDQISFIAAWNQDGRGAKEFPSVGR